MKVFIKNLSLCLAGIFLAGVVQAQNKSELSHQPGSKQDTQVLTLKAQREPSLPWVSRVRLSGLFVDLVKPQQTWPMLYASAPARPVPEPIPPYLLPVKALRPMNDDFAVHEPDFVLLKLSF
jgi:hypothetical protein